MLPLSCSRVALSAVLGAVLGHLIIRLVSIRWGNWQLMIKKMIPSEEEMREKSSRVQLERLLTDLALIVVSLEAC